MGRKLARTNLPVERGAFVGRVKLLEEIGRHLDGGQRLVTLTGPEGIGKTRLGLRAAAIELSRCGQHGGVWLVDLRGAHSALDVVHAMLLVLGTLPEPGAALGVEQSRLVEALVRGGPTLFLLDAADRCKGEVAFVVGQLLPAAAECSFLVTSGKPLGAAGEVELKVGSLKLAKQSGDAKQVAAAEAVALFIERAAEARRGFSPTPADLVACAQIVRHLDGVPQAIEIAAARTRALAPRELVERLPRKVTLLDVERRSALAGAVAWSVELLAPWEQAALAQCAVFSGGFDVAAAAAVLELSRFPDAPAVPAALESLLEKALLRVVEPPRGTGRWPDDEVPLEERRLDLPGAVREAAEQRLDPGVPREALQNRHAAHYLTVGSALAEGVDGHGGISMRHQLEDDADNLVAVARRALAADTQTLTSITSALRATLSLEPVLTMRGPHELFIELLDRGLAPADIVGVPYALRARAYEARARARRARHQLSQSHEDLTAALACARRAKDRLLEARAIANLGTHWLLVGRTDKAAADYEAATEMLDEVGDKKVTGRALGFYGLLDHHRGDLPSAIRRYGDAIRAHRDVGDRRWEGIHTGQLGAAYLELGQLADARQCLKRAMAIHRELQNRRNEGIVWSWQGDLHAADGELEEARVAWERALTLHRQVGDARGEALALGRLAALARRNRSRATAEELFLRAKDIVERLADDELKDMLLVLERGAVPPNDAREAARAAGRVVRALV
ncbi:MAG: tetratricopeptide repeat protein [Deltaproteobacteria bacterium]|nr:tetratricopeptide repeat protein [Deltaproteobacteria bacterium]